MLECNTYIICIKEKNKSHFISWGMSFTNNKSKSGSNVDPWGMLLVRFCGFKKFLLILTYVDKRDSNHKIIFFKNPVHLIFLRSTSRSAASKAFCNSIKIKFVYFQDSKTLFCQLTMINKSLLKLIWFWQFYNLKDIWFYLFW